MCYSHNLLFWGTQSSSPLTKMDFGEYAKVLYGIGVDNKEAACSVGRR